ncbi:GNAT family N-acetyltransferase [Allosaccharopolyspora coralli]|nr:GNAT family N-acetyltransferase [Allosaccharopolyspora coralli]
MKASFHRSLAEFWQRARGLYEADPVTHTNAVWIAASAEVYRDSVPMLCTLATDGGELGAAYLRTPPHPGLVSALRPEWTPVAVEALLERDPQLPGVQGPVEEAEAFAEAWTARTGTEAVTHMEQSLYRLGDLRVPGPPRGVAENAHDGDLAWLAQAHREFAVEAGGTYQVEEPDVVAMRAVLDAGQRGVLWKVDGEPVACAFWTRPVVGMSRILRVYTEPAHRGRGYGSAVTAAASRRARAAGANEVVLFTDRANPVSNSIYRRLGYVPVSRMVMLDFVAAPGT